MYVCVDVGVYLVVVIIIGCGNVEVLFLWLFGVDWCVLFLVWVCVEDVL